MPAWLTGSQSRRRRVGRPHQRGSWPGTRSSENRAHSKPVHGGAALHRVSGAGARDPVIPESSKRNVFREPKPFVASHPCEASQGAWHMVDPRTVLLGIAVAAMATFSGAVEAREIVPFGESVAPGTI